MNDDFLLLRPPHQQMVFTFPKVLRGFFRHHRTLYGDIARQVNAMILKFCNAAAGCKLHSAAVIAYACAGEFVRFSPHFSERLAHNMLQWDHSGPGHRCRSAS